MFGKPTKSNLRKQTHEILKQADFDIRRQHYNTVVSASMKLFNTIEKSISSNINSSKIQRSELGNSYELFTESMSILLRILYPIAPHITETIWQELGFIDGFGNLVSATWPKIDESALIQDEINIVCQINGKVRSNLKISSNASNDEIITTALKSEAFKKFSLGKGIQKTIIVPNRLINIVLKK